MKLITLFLFALYALGAVCDNALLAKQFIDWMKIHKKVYNDEDFAIRFANFKASVARVEARNAMPGRKATYGLNEFSDLSPEEFSSFMLMHPDVELKRNEDVPVMQPTKTAPQTVDWRYQGGVTPVKNQKQCGSCWAFAVTETVESSWILGGHATNTTLNLAPQQVVDCDKGSYGCNGGFPETAYKYIINAGGIQSEDTYPYKAVDQTCQFDKTKVTAKISNWKYATSFRDENTLRANTAVVPPSICVDASNWQDYKSGVMTAWECAWFVRLNHCVQLVGYDMTASTPYYLVRNSWGTGWGVNGHILLEANADTCGLTREATIAIL